MHVSRHEVTLKTIKVQTTSKYQENSPEGRTPPVQHVHKYKREEKSVFPSLSVFCFTCNILTKLLNKVTSFTLQSKILHD